MWTFSPKSGIGTLIAHRPPGDWVFQIPYFPPFEEPADFTPEICRDRIHDAVGMRNLSVEVKSVRPWVMTAQVAARYRSGPIFLAGDAAHRFPPTGGLGLNTGVADVHNLVWKLAAVLAGNAPESLLDSYERERRPIAVDFCAHATTNFEKTFDVLAAVGIPRASRRVLDTVSRSAWVRAVPRWLRRWIMRLSMGVMARRLGMLDRQDARAMALRAAAARTIANQRAHYRFWGLDLGVRYRDGAIADASAHTLTDPERYTASTAPGGRLPHAWMECDGRPMSTLDLVDRERWTLLIGDADAGWVRAANAIRDRFAVTVVTLGGTTADVWRGFGLTDDAALLVRPDGHIAWRGRAGPDAAPAALVHALAQLPLGESPGGRSMSAHPDHRAIGAPKIRFGSKEET